jgi:hypothetical protein
MWMSASMADPAPVPGIDAELPVERDDRDVLRGEAADPAGRTVSALLVISGRRDVILDQRPHDDPRGVRDTIRP